MNSKDVKQAFKQNGISVRVADLGKKFRICTVSGERFNKESALAVSASLGFFDVTMAPGGQFNQGHELIAYKRESFHVVA